MMPSPAPSLALIGLRAVGKSTLGAALAQALELPFVDLDEELAREHGQPAGTLLRERGEATFRELESATLERVATRIERVVLATGGGVVERAANRALLGGYRCLWLRAPLESLARRVAADPGTRPALSHADPEADLEAAHARRSPHYAALADLVVDMGERSVEEVVAELLAQGV